MASAYANLEELDEALKQHLDECITETGASREEAEKLLKHDFTSADPKIKVSFIYIHFSF